MSLNAMLYGGTWVAFRDQTYTHADLVLYSVPLHRDCAFWTYVCLEDKGNLSIIVSECTSWGLRISLS